MVPISIASFFGFFGSGELPLAVPSWRRFSRLIVDEVGLPFLAAVQVSLIAIFQVFHQELFKELFFGPPTMSHFKFLILHT